MEVLNKIKDRNIGLYIRKENYNENLSTGYGRLQWLRHELEEHKGEIKLYIDEYGSVLMFSELMSDIKDGEIEGLLLWSIEDIRPNLIVSLGLECENMKIPIVSFCESYEWINELVENQKTFKDKKVG
ncbi:hypothetical protein PM004_15745 [Clostridium paraputrificum]|uniref:hypothetical protein n=1 Tax=Clostridium TaxID=1485 RepID=UPI00232B8D5A|nr:MULTISPECIES: hypothetical protein [Clostridium]MDB2090800.1 hypothetical protein [Clostridium paraputrificum]MDB2097360.1 hypothetical protein [Clostridium paraputrificum]MDU1180663.1 hypothetical protein [Clostridium sp.]MDU1228138.1 hypothetical protein [Clostridium sp.]MDU7654226.1 hypothetical protein [Clostridium sp.]